MVNGQVIDRRSYAKGTKFVGKTGLAKLHRGEAVIPKGKGSLGKRAKKFSKGRSLGGRR